MILDSESIDTMFLLQYICTVATVFCFVTIKYCSHIHKNIVHHVTLYSNTENLNLHEKTGTSKPQWPRPYPTIHPTHVASGFHVNDGIVELIPQHVQQIGKYMRTSIPASD